MTGSSIVTVLGEVAPEEIGVTMMHEHVFIDVSNNFWGVDDPELVHYRDRPVTLDLVDLLRRYPFSLVVDNVRLDDEQLAVEEVGALRAAGGTTLVDCTVDGIGRDPRAVQRVSRATGVHIVQGTGLYIERAHPPWVADATVDQLAELFASEVRIGIGETGIRAGIIGEIGTSGIDPGTWRKVADLTPAEEKVLRAAGAASVATGAAVTVHLDPRGQGGDAVIDILEREGVPPDRIVLDHLDAHPDLEYHLRVAERGVYLEYDHFGREYDAPHMGMRYTQDSRRMELVRELVARGHERQLLVSQDVCAKVDLRKFGGNGYGHFLGRIAPQLLSDGLSPETLETILVDNPRRVLSF